MQVRHQVNLGQNEAMHERLAEDPPTSTTKMVQPNIVSKHATEGLRLDFQVNTFENFKI